MNATTVEVGIAVGIHEKIHTMIIQAVVIILGVVEGHAVLKTRATAGLYEYAKNFIFRSIFLLERLNLLGGGFR